MKRNHRREGAARVARRRKLLIIVGGTIVLFTFLVKDGIREYLKGLDDLLMQAEDVFTIQQSIGTVEAQIDWWQQEAETRRIKERASNPDLGGAANYSNETRTAIALLRWRDARLQDEFQQMSMLVERMPIGQATLKPILDKMEVAVKGIHETSEKREKELTEGAQNKLTLGWSYVDSGFALLSTIPVAHAAGEVLQEARIEEQFLDRMYRFFSWVSYVLYIVGWAMALRARLSTGDDYGIDG